MSELVAGREGRFQFPGRQSEGDPAGDRARPEQARQDGKRKIGDQETRKSLFQTGAEFLSHGEADARRRIGSQKLSSLEVRPWRSAIYSKKVRPFYE